MSATFADYLREHDKADLLGSAFECGCGRKCMPDALFDASAHDDIDGQFRCSICLADKEREAIVAAEAAAPWPTEEQMNDLRAQRETLLIRSDWTELPSNQARFTDEEREAWVTYRQAVRDVVTQAKAGHKVAFPDLPSQE